MIVVVQFHRWSMVVEFQTLQLLNLFSWFVVLDYYYLFWGGCYQSQAEIIDFEGSRYHFPYPDFSPCYHYSHPPSPLVLHLVAGLLMTTMLLSHLDLFIIPLCFFHVLRLSFGDVLFFTSHWDSYCSISVLRFTVGQWIDSFSWLFNPFLWVSGLLFPTRLPIKQTFLPYPY